MPSPVGLIVLLAFVFVGPAILFLALRHSRSIIALIFWGMIAVLLMWLEHKFAVYCAGIGSATSGSQNGYREAKLGGCYFIISLVVYFVAALSMLHLRKKKGIKMKSRELE